MGRRKRRGIREKNREVGGARGGAYDKREGEGGVMAKHKSQALQEKE